jgi:hypothetical protein
MGRVLPRSLRIGTVLFHGTSDRDTAAAQINTQLMAIARAVVKAAGGDPTLIYPTGGFANYTTTNPSGWKGAAYDSRRAMEKSPLLWLWDDAVSPLWSEWLSFYSDKQHWYDAVTELFTSWEDYEAWADRVNALRDRVEAAGVKVSLPRLHEFSKSVQQKVEEATGDVWKIAKYGVIGGLALGGAFLISKIVGDFRSKS